MNNTAIIVLPFPPSVNGLYAGKARRYKSPRYKAWLSEAEFAFFQQNTPSFAEPVSVHMKFGRPDKRVRDVANYEKATSDFLVNSGVLSDDSLIEDNRQSWCEGINGVQIEITPLESAA